MLRVLVLLQLSCGVFPVRVELPLEMSCAAVLMPQSDRSKLLSSVEFGVVRVDALIQPASVVFRFSFFAWLWPPRDCTGTELYAIGIYCTGTELAIGSSAPYSALYNSE